MELNITSLLALFCLLALSAFVNYAAKRLHVPYTVLLVAVGIVLVPLTKLPVIGNSLAFIDAVQLTPDLLFFIFLPILIFESGYSMSIRTMLENSWTIGLLAVGGLLISAFGVATAMYFLLNWAGIDVPFVVLLLFASIISATDPVAVLALFKDFGAPRRLSIIFEGESLFNDGTAVALFLVVLVTATNGFHGAPTVINGVIGFVVMVVLGILMGLVAAGLFTAALRGTRVNEFVSATLMIISAHLVFITGELINEHEWSVGEVEVRVSSIIATTVLALFMGNYSRHALSPRTDSYVEKAIAHLAFIANSLVFLLAGLLFASTQIPLSDLWLPMVVSVIVVAVMRVISVFAVTSPINATGVDAPVPRSWQLLLSWGSLRGALAIIVVLSLPPNFEVPGWSLSSSPRDFLLALTISCILVTLFVKAPLIGPMMRRLAIDEPEPVEVARHTDLALYALLAERAGLENSETRAMLRDARVQVVEADLAEDLDLIQRQRDQLRAEHGDGLFEKALRLTAIGIEENALKQLYVNDEVGVPTYRRLLSTLRVQTETLMDSDLGPQNPSRSRERRDVFDRLMDTVLSWLSRGAADPHEVLIESMESARARLVMSRRVVRILEGMQTEFSDQVFAPQAFDPVIAMYREIDRAATDELDKLTANSAEELGPELQRLADLSRAGWGRRAVATLRSRGIANEHDEEWLARQYGDA